MWSSASQSVCQQQIILFYQQICVLFIHWNETMIIKKKFPHCLYGLWNFPLLLFSIFIEIMSNLFKQFFMRCIPNSIIVLVIYFIVAHPNKQSYLLTYLLAYILTIPSVYLLIFFFFFFHDMKNLITVIVIVQLGRSHRSVSDSNCTRN